MEGEAVLLHLLVLRLGRDEPEIKQGGVGWHNPDSRHEPCLMHILLYALIVVLEDALGSRVLA